MTASKSPWGEVYKTIGGETGGMQVFTISSPYRTPLAASHGLKHKFLTKIDDKKLNILNTLNIVFPVV